jgi:hypothetical protein
MSGHTIENRTWSNAEIGTTNIIAVARVKKSRSVMIWSEGINSVNIMEHEKRENAVTEVWT